MTTTTSKNIVVFGGTGKQGSAFVRALAAYNHPITQYNIYVLSRTPGKADALSSLPGVHIVPAANDYADQPAAALAATGLQKGEVYGVYDVQGYMPEDADEAQAKGIVDAAKAYGVQHFIYASVQHDDVETGNDSLDPKRRTERHLRAIGLPYTALRATDFMDNWLPDAGDDVAAYRTVLLRHTFDGPKKLQMVSVRDVGRAGAKALHEGRFGAVPLAGDANTMDEVRETYRRVLGGEVGEVPLEGGGPEWLEESIGKLTNMYNEKGYRIPEGETAKFIDVENFEAFLERFKRERDEK